MANVLEGKCWNISKTGDYITIKLSGLLTNEELPLFEIATHDLNQDREFCHVVIHCGDLGDLPLSWARALIQLQKKTRAINKHLRLIEVSPKMSVYIREQGLNQSLPVVGSLREALVDFGLATKKLIDVNFINPFLAATMHVLQVQASTKSTPGQMSIKEDKTKHMGDISGVIGLVSDTFNGAVVISFPEKTFLQIMTRMLGEPVTEINKDIQDGAAELTNMIFGQAKVTLNEKGYGLKTAIPSVVTGKDHSVQSLTKGPQVLVPFTTDIGDFFIEICTSQ